MRINLKKYYRQELPLRNGDRFQICPQLIILKYE